MSSKPGGGGSTETVKVMVRVRPMNTKEKQRGCLSSVQVDSSQNQVYIQKPDEAGNQKAFAFDSVYDIDSIQQNVYDEGAFPLVESVIEGYNGTIFAYGQTGCGKTHTMLGLPEIPEQRGIIPNCFNHIFGFIDSNTDGTKFLVRCSYLEIYNEEIRDLLIDNGKREPQKLELKEDPQKGLFVKDLTCLIVKSIPEIEKAMIFGTNNRKTAETLMNSTSSRSHSIFTIYIETGRQVNGEQRIKAGKLNLVDLAGSERQSKTGAGGQTLKEGIKINLSLTALGNVISALVDGKSSHIPYRDSKLTRLLQDSLGGNTKTVMIAAVSPADYNYEETLSTLRYASRAKAIKNKPKVNEDPKDALLKEYEAEIKKLREMLQQMNSGSQVNVAKEIKNFHKQISDDHIKMDFEQVDISQKQVNQEETIEDLISKLEQKGKKVVIQDEDALRNSQLAVNTPSDKNAGSPKQDAANFQSQLQDASQLNSNNVQIESELKSKEQALEQERQEKEQLAKLIQELEKKLVVGGNALEEKERDQVQKQREIQIQLRQQKKKQKQLLEEKRKREEEMLLVEKNYKDLQEEVDDMREIIKKLREKYKQAQQEIEDLQHESQFNKEDLLDTIRQQDREVKFANKVMHIMLSENELYKLKQRAQWDENRQDWKMPLFYVTNDQKEIQFPTINAQSRVNQVKEDREIYFEDENGYQPNQMNNTKNSFKKANINGHRNNDSISIVVKQQQSALDKYEKNHKISANNNNSVENMDYVDEELLTNTQKKSITLKANNINTKKVPIGGTQANNSSNFNSTGQIPAEIPERRRKYLQQNMNDEPDEEESQQKKRLNVHLQPLQQSVQARNLSMPSQKELESQHPLQFAPNQKGGAKPKLDSIEHQNFKVNPNSVRQIENNGGPNKSLIANLPSPSQGGGGKKGKLEPIFKQ